MSLDLIYQELISAKKNTEKWAKGDCPDKEFLLMNLQSISNLKILIQEIAQKIENG